MVSKGYGWLVLVRDTVGKGYVWLLRDMGGCLGIRVIGNGYGC